jgi:hypothetical protein
MGNSTLFNRPSQIALFSDIDDYKMTRKFALLSGRGIISVNKKEYASLNTFRDTYYEPWWELNMYA